MRLSRFQALSFAGAVVFTCVFWGCALLDPDRQAYPFVVACDFVILVGLIICMVVRGGTSRDSDQGVRLVGPARNAFLALCVLLGVLTIVAVLAHVRVGAYDLYAWMLTVLICLPNDLAYPPRDAPSYDPPLPPQR